MKRLFIAINLPKDIKRRLTRIITQINADSISENLRINQRGSAFRWLPPENWHLTLDFLGYQPDEAIGPILKSLKETVSNFNALEINFEKAILAPPASAKAMAGKPNKPARMIWLACTRETSKNLSKIKNYLDDSLVKNGVRFKIDNRKFNAHLTLVRFRSPLINVGICENLRENLRESALAFYARSLDLMESCLNPFGKLRSSTPRLRLEEIDAEQGRSIKRTGAEYEILSSLPFLDF